ncbi:alpha/beta fold hydrolase [Helcobacillus massiliensis]|uniref:alpha/beta fold hydrolase n=1 Tax=Helcobacillus TaxID=1161125 RepID=UPI001EF6C502|nr:MULTISPECIES: alpha/beta fold hydrolase [Helcobacillus]MCG7427983.1 alpha/beta fold hydrolase [Helcobacillus sp. ACRRO]MCT1558351.1 alpha/beta fold hydrolase [Helcobacillus massiliensis]MCT2036577.1 alpha/beta fold hydrolase [Helcobacillus massiliensis]MCT2332320.1 alpha/beta fold hydrolase [Helcobacillus massiliensis]MDK7743018.1 alpha/beta fold hydrolase [Helcobacillus massiliensis]
MNDNEKPQVAAVEIGDGDGAPVVFIHGLFGRGRNFSSIAKGMQPGFRCHLIDLPNHGMSAWTEDFSYTSTADIVAEHLRDGIAAGGPVDIVGHSMGGKVAMLIALRHPDLVRRLVVVDIAPVGDGGPNGDSPSGRGDFEHLLDTLARLDLDSLTGRTDADRRLAADVPDASVRAFLLQNLSRTHRAGSHKDSPTGDGFHWQPNFPLLHRAIDQIKDWPANEIDGSSFTGPVLWIAGADSDYIRPEDLPVMRALFPSVLQVTIKNARHWVHADQPDAFISALRTFLRADQKTAAAQV